MLGFTVKHANYASGRLLQRKLQQISQGLLAMLEKKTNGNTRVHSIRSAYKKLAFVLFDSLQLRMILLKKVFILITS